ILAISYLGTVLTYIFKIPFPSIILSMLILFIFLQKKILKLRTIEKTADFLLVNMTLLFIPATVKLIKYIDLLKVDFLKIIFLLVITTALTMIVTSQVVHWMIVLKERKEVKK
ncbi:MAG: CidA/LrgA family protein, partial [Fusobacteriaceae bacterium]